MPLSDAFGGFGGIAKFNRDFLTALDACPSVRQVDVIPRVIAEDISDQIPEAVIYHRRSAGGKARFLFHLCALALTQRKFDLVICAHINLLSVSWLAAHFCRARLALIVHGVEAWFPTRSLLRNFAVRKVDSVIAVSALSAQRLSAWSGIASDRIEIVPNCVDLDEFAPASRDPALADRYGLAASKVIMTMGRLASQERLKGFDEVIDVMPELLRRIPNLKYMIVGGGADLERLRAKADAVGVSEHVVFTGRIQEAEKAAHYNLADAYVMPSSGEGFGIVLIEAAACGIPVVGSSIDGSREALRDGSLGRLVDPRKPDELIEAIIGALGGSEKGARNPAIEYFSVGNFRNRVAAWISTQMPSQ